jgi:hypothetical protein
MSIVGLALLSLCGCAATPPAHSVVGTVQATGAEMGTLRGVDGRCKREHGVGAADAVRLTFKNDSSKKLTVIDVPYEPSPTHVDVIIAPTRVTLTRRVCTEFDAHVRTQTVDGNDGNFASGTLHLTCKLPAHEEDLDVMVDFEQC